MWSCFSLADGQVLFKLIYYYRNQYGCSVIINSMAGYAFARLHFKGRDTLFGIALLGMIVPAQVTMLPAYVIMKYNTFCRRQ